MDDPFRYIKEKLQEREIVYGNLETPISRRAYRFKRTPCAWGACQSESERRYRRLARLSFRAHPQAAGILKEAGFTVMGTANNHAEDQGPLGLLETIQHLRDQDLSWVGTGAQPEEAWRPFLFKKEGLSVALIAATAVWNFKPSRAGAFYAGASFKELTRDLPGQIRALRSEVDFIILALHSGGESSRAPWTNERRLLRHLAEAGLDLFIGSHPHVLRGVQLLGSTLVFWSMGNFLFDSNRGAWGESALLRLEFIKEGERRYMDKISLQPITLDARPGKLPRPAQPKKAQKILEEVLRISEPFKNPPGSLKIEGGELRIKLRDSQG